MKSHDDTTAGLVHVTTMMSSKLELFCSENTFVPVPCT